MTENSLLWATNNTGDGSSSGYSADDMFELFRSLFTAGASYTNLSGVSPDYKNGLSVSGSSSPIIVGTGAALVYGIPYFNNADVNVAIPTPVSATRIDRIVLRASWSAQTVRITRIAGSEGGGPPSLTQSEGVTWDMPLAQMSVTTGGVITVTGERKYLRLVGDGGIDTSKLADGAVTEAKLGDDAVTNDKIAAGAVNTGSLAGGAVTTAKIADANVTTAKVADAAIATAKLGDTAVTTGKLTNSAVTNAKLANMAQSTIKGRAAGAGTGAPADLSAAQVVAILTAADGPSSGLDADTVDGQHAAAFAAASHAHGTADIANSAVTNAKLANMAQSTIKGRAAGAGTGAPADLSAAQVANIVNSSNVTAWANLSLQSGVSASANNTPQYRLVGDELQLRGAVRFTSYGAGLAATLPYSMPGSRYMSVKLWQGDAYLWLTGNTLYVYGGGVGADYSLEGIRFST